MLLVDVMSQVGELSVAVRTGLCLAGALLLHLVDHHRVVVVVIVVVHQATLSCRLTICLCWPPCCD